MATRLEAFIRDELARRRHAWAIRPTAAQPRHQQTQDRGRRTQPAASRAGELGLADIGRDERTAASVRLAAAPRAGRGSAGATIVRCGACGLVIGTQTAALAPRYCPRCLARRRALVPLAVPETLATMSAYCPTRLDLRLLRTPNTPGIARRRVAEAFAGDLDIDELRDLTLLTSELVTNALMHGRGSIELHALLDETRLTVDITDQGGGFEHAAHVPDPDALGGRGLHIVDTIASRWGIGEGSSHVWFELDRHRPQLTPADPPLPL